MTANKTNTMTRPKRYRERGAGAVFDWDALRPVGRGETLPVFLIAVLLGFVSVLLCYQRGYLLLYGDAVAHLGIARRVFDARYPGWSQLGGVWLPLPHILMLPFVQKISWWQSGLGGAPMSVLSYAASVAGIWRLARRMMSPRWALVAATFYALNPNLLYLATTAMTETLFLALLVWTVVATSEGMAALQAGEARRAEKKMLLTAVLITGMVFTRYDGWIVGAVVWCCFAWSVWRADAVVRRKLRVTCIVATVLVVAGPLLWFWYNHHFMGDWLDFIRGPYSAAAIERRTAPPGQHYRGWHNVGWAALFFTRTAQVDAAFWETGFAVMAAAVWGLWLVVRETPGLRRAHPNDGEAVARVGHPMSSEHPELASLLLWVPLPFYIYSIAYGSVPIFIPQLWPHSYYNARYGMEMLPALAVFGTLAVAHGMERVRASSAAAAKIATRLAMPVAMMLCVANSMAMMYRVPAVLKEGMVNATTRVAFEKALAQVIEEFPPDAPVMMYTSAHIGAAQIAGRPLKSLVSEMDWDSWHVALDDPAKHAAYVIAMKGDPVDAAVTAHPEGLDELQVLCTTGQPCARIYRSTEYEPDGKSK